MDDRLRTAEAIVADSPLILLADFVEDLAEDFELAGDLFDGADETVKGLGVAGRRVLAQAA